MHLLPLLHEIAATPCVRVAIRFQRVAIHTHVQVVGGQVRRGSSQIAVVAAAKLGAGHAATLERSIAPPVVQPVRHRVVADVELGGQATAHVHILLRALHNFDGVLVLALRQQRRRARVLVHGGRAGAPVLGGLARRGLFLGHRPLRRAKRIAVRRAGRARRQRRVQRRARRVQRRHGRRVEIEIVGARLAPNVRRIEAVVGRVGRAVGVQEGRRRARRER